MELFTIYPLRLMNTSAPVRHVVVTQGFLFNIAGSETVAFEVAEYFSREGARVTVVTHGINDVWASQFDALEQVTVMLSSDPDLDSVLRADPPDLAWLHHGLIPEFVLRNPRDVMVIFNQMSGAHPLEFPYSLAAVRSLGTLLAFNATEILDIQLDSGILDGIDSERLIIFGNPAPDAFYVDRPNATIQLQRLLVVSNHLPPELTAAVDLLRNVGVEVDVLGLEADKADRVERVSPATIAAADAVVTIGKTVQYSLASGTPVYCYDKFGGPGWLNEINFDRAREFNFSGRSFASKSAEEIFDEIMGDFTEASHDAAALRSAHGASLTMGQRMPDIIAKAKSTGAPENTLLEVDIIAHLKMQQSLGAYVAIAAANEEMRASAMKETESTRRYLAETQTFLRDLEATSSYKLARKLSSIATRAKSLLRR
ncbi:MAG: hypothetical protein ACOH14_01590 [Rhodoglobus sp.]